MNSRGPDLGNGCGAGEDHVDLRSNLWGEGRKFRMLSSFMV